MPSNKMFHKQYIVYFWTSNALMVIGHDDLQWNDTKRKVKMAFLGHFLGTVLMYLQRKDIFKVETLFEFLFNKRDHYILCGCPIMLYV